MADELSRAELQEMERRERRRSLLAAIRRVTPLLVNPEGLRRLRAITDDEWQAAVDRDAQAASDAA